jgi:polyisoprenoid-binding protein YceI
MRGLFPFLAGTLLLAVFSISHAEVKTFKTVQGDEKNLVEFVSQATLETVMGHTSNVTGSVDFDPADLAAAKSATFTVDLRTLDTGIALRNKHMRDQFLHTALNPMAVFTLGRVVSTDKPALASGETAHVTVEGELKINSVSKSCQIPLTLTYRNSDPESVERLYGGKGDILIVQGTWTVKLADHGIKRPEMLFMRLSEEQKLTVSLAATDIPPEKK